MTRSRETILARVWQNPPTSKRYVPRDFTMRGFGEGVNWRVYDQRNRRFIGDDEIERIDPDELMRLP